MCALSVAQRAGACARAAAMRRSALVSVVAAVLCCSVSAMPAALRSVAMGGELPEQASCSLAAERSSQLGRAAYALTAAMRARCRRRWLAAAGMRRGVALAWLAEARRVAWSDGNLAARARRDVTSHLMGEAERCCCCRGEARWCAAARCSARALRALGAPGTSCHHRTPNRQNPNFFSLWAARAGHGWW